MHITTHSLVLPAVWYRSERNKYLGLGGHDSEQYNMSLGASCCIV